MIFQGGKNHLRTPNNVKDNCHLHPILTWLHKCFSFWVIHAVKRRQKKEHLPTRTNSTENHKQRVLGAGPLSSCTAGFGATQKSISLTDLFKTELPSWFNVYSLNINCVQGRKALCWMPVSFQQSTAGTAVSYHGTIGSGFTAYSVYHAVPSLSHKFHLPGTTM